jgi:hypothetical protein
VDIDHEATRRLKETLEGRTPSGDADGPAPPALNAPALEKLTDTSPAMATQIRNGERVLYRVYLLDFLDEDRDQVELSVDGVSLGKIDLGNAGQSVLIPLTRGTPSHMRLLATADGGGGVTVGMVSSMGEARTSVLQVGGFEQWNVTAR